MTTERASGTVHHPVFARLYGQVLGRVMEAQLGRLRREHLAGLSGRIVEVGAGSGLNFAHYPAAVTEVIALEPEAYLRRKAQQAAASAPVRITVRDGRAEALSLDAACFDGAVASLVLCTVQDPAASLAELHRVLRPGGELRFLEHVRSERRLKRVMQRLLDRAGLWPLVAGGCHCARDTVAAVRVAGFELQRLRRFDLGPGWTPANPMVLGVARPGHQGYRD